MSIPQTAIRGVYVLIERQVRSRRNSCATQPRRACRRVRKVVKRGRTYDDAGRQANGPVSVEDGDVPKVVDDTGVDVAAKRPGHSVSSPVGWGTQLTIPWPLGRR
jgi:hypothetical protein